MIRVLVAEDSATVRALLVAVLEEDPEIEVVGEATNGQEAVDLAAALRPDIVTMDIHMPVLDGFEATKEIMIESPTRILIVSSAAEQDVELALNAVRVGALMLLPTPANPGSDRFEEQRNQLLRAIRSMAQIKVVRQWRRRGDAHPPPVRPPSRGAKVVGIAASTGGPAALQRILMDVPRNFPAPILVVQHIANGFTTGLSTWLALCCGLRVRIPDAGERLQPSTVYLAPDDRHLGVDARGCCVLSDGPAIGGFRPSANYLFESMAASYGSAAVAVILTGMGRDGVDGAARVRAAGGTVLAQDEASSLVYGMPKEAVRAGVADTVLPIEGIAEWMSELARGKKRGP